MKVSESSPRKRGSERKRESGEKKPKGKAQRAQGRIRDAGPRGPVTAERPSAKGPPWSHGARPFLRHLAVKLEPGLEKCLLIGGERHVSHVSGDEGRNAVS